MNEPRDTALARMPCHACGGLDMHRLERLAALLDVEADGVHRSECAGKGRGDRRVVMHVGRDRLQTRALVRKQRSRALGTARSDPDREPVPMQMTYDRAAEKAGAS